MVRRRDPVGPTRRDNQISVSPAYRYLREGLTVLTDHAPDLSTALEWAAAALHRRCLDDGSLRERDNAAAMRVAAPGWETPAVPRW